MTIKVLIVDDHAIVREGLRLILEAQPDLTVVGEADEGRAAVAGALQLRPDVILMDLAMPGLNGIEATRQISRELPQTRVIVLSGYATKEHVFQALQAGAAGYLLKDGAASEVVRAIRAVYVGRSYVSEKLREAGLVGGSDASGQGRPAKGPLASLSPREKEILQLVVEGSSSASIAERLSLSVKTIETYRSRLMRKLGVHDVASLVKFAIQHGITSVE